jgi:hypothetical protein
MQPKDWNQQSFEFDTPGDTILLDVELHRGLPIERGP